MTQEHPEEQKILEESLTLDDQCRHVLEEIGSKVAEARKAQSGVIQKISKDLRIRSSLLEAVEKGDIDEFPGDSYYYGFTRSYAKSLSVDVAAEIKKFRVLREAQQDPKNIDSRLVSMATSSVINDQTKIAAATIAATGKVVRNENIIEKPNLSHAFKVGMEGKSRNGMFLAALGFIAILGYAVWIIFTGIQDSSDINTASQAYQNAEIIAEKNVVAQDGADETQNSEFRVSDNVVQDVEGLGRSDNSNGLEYGSPVNARVWVEGTTGSWVSVVDIGKVNVAAGQTGEIFARELKPNDVYYVPQGQQILLKSGNAGGIRLIVDGEVQEPLGRKGQVRYASLNPDVILAGKSITEGVKLYELLQAVKRSQTR